MNLLIVGDLHGRVGLITRYADRLTREFELSVAATVQVGDFGFYDHGEFAAYRSGSAQLPLRTYAIHGNHDSPEMVDALATGAMTVADLTLFPVGGGFATITHVDEQVMLMGLGGAYTVPERWGVGMSPFAEDEPETALTRWEAIGRPAVDVLVTHEVPTQLGRALGDPRYGNPYRVGSPGIRALWLAVRPRLLVCGHYHVLLQKVEDGLPITVLPEAARGALVWDSTTGQQTMFTLRT